MCLNRFLVCETEKSIGIFKLSEDYPILEATLMPNTRLFFSIHTANSLKEVHTMFQSIKVINPKTFSTLGSYEIEITCPKGIIVDGNDLYFTLNPIDVITNSSTSKKYNIHVVNVD